MTARRWWGVLALLAAVCVAIPLAALADSGHALPGLPSYTYGYRGDASGYYSTARAILSGVPGLGIWLALLVLAAAGCLWLAWRARAARPATGLVGAVLVLALVAAAVIVAGDRGSVGAVGWPLLWAVPLAPLRVLGVVSMRNAFTVGLAVTLLVKLATLVAVAHAALWASGRRQVGLLAAAIWALWPLYVGLLLGHSAWAKGSWQVTTGLAMASEPLSTACCAVAIALLLRPQQTDLVRVLAGIAVGYATLARPSNGLLALLAVGFVLWRHGVRAVGPVLAGGLALMPVYLAFLPKRYGYGFSSGKGGAFVGMSPHNIVRTFADSPLWSWRTLAVLLPPALVGVVAVGRAAALLLGSWVIVNSGFYSLAPNTYFQPRYLFAARPELLVLVAAGLWAVAALLSDRAGRPIVRRLRFSSRDGQPSAVKPS